MKLKNIAGLLIIMITLTWGCSENAPEATKTKTKSSEEVTKKEPLPSIEKKVIAPIKLDAPDGVDASSGPDTYGRNPGDEHYGHDHAPKENQTNAPVAVPIGTAAPATGEPDKFGRKPGEEHYGHDHE